MKVSVQTLFAGVAAGLWMAGSVHAATLTLPDVADAFVNGGDTTTDSTGVNFGTLSTLIVKYHGASGSLSRYDRKAYIRFDTSALTSATDSATLNLTVSLNNDGKSPATPQPFTLEVYGLLTGATSWGETTITWNNAPGNDTSSANGLLATDVVDLGTLNILDTDIAGVTVSFSTAALTGFVNDAIGVGQVTLIVVRTDTNSNSINLTFASKENTTFAAPSLVVAVPEPASMALVGVGLLPWLRRRA